MDEEKLIEKKIRSERVFDGTLLHVYKDEVLLPNGNTSTREYIRHLGAVAIVAMDEQENVIIERQYRYPLQDVISEIPAGKLNSITENPLDAAKRELQEETGIVAKNWRFIGIYNPSAAYCDEIIYLYLATGLSYGKQHLDEDEFLIFSAVPLSRLIQQILLGVIRDGKTQSALLITNQILQDEKAAQ